MNKQGKNGIGWCDMTWNPVVGCKNGCFYCYAKPMFERFHPGQNFRDIHLYLNRFNEPIKFKKSLKIFAGSMTDLMDPRISMNTIWQIFQTVWECPQHTFIFLTKSIYAYIKLADFPENCWIGITITGDETEWYNMRTIDYLMQTKAKVKFLNFEPLLGTGVHKLIRPGIDWIIIGGLTGIKAKGYKPDLKEVEKIIKQAGKYGIPVFIKDNLKWPEKIQNYPKLA